MLEQLLLYLIPAEATNSCNGLIYPSSATCFTDSTPFDVHLQWFAAEDEGRTEEPTEHKLRKAREEGKVAKSVELSSALVMLFGIATLGLISSYFLKNVLSMLRFFLQHSTELDVSVDGGLMPAFYAYFFKLTLPVLLVSFLAAFLGNVMQVGFLFSAKPITPDLDRIVPRFGRFFRRALFSGEAAFNLGKTLLKVAIIFAIAFINIRSQLPKLVNAVDMHHMMAFRLVVIIAFRIVVEAALAMLVLSIPDYLFQRRQHREALKMSRQELKEERRMYEGDPLIKSRLRERMRDLLTRNMMRAVPKADVVITNPTHYSVAVEYDRLVMEAPTVTAKGVDAIALKIREIAKDNDVPLIENKPLARTLYQEVEIGDAIPEKYYEVMAIILAEVYKMAGRKVSA
ncbi:MAG: flagellar biosynthesis protein FlhB [Spirochaetaceae bacterium]|nr:MAG: flagellar biosynthesis protein FlhB [Spirochaetaceae bacterium]